MNRFSLLFIALLLNGIAHTQGFGIGITNPTGILHTSSTGLAMLIDGYGLSGTGFTSTLAVRSARGTSLAPTPALTGDRIGSILYSGQASSTALHFNNGAGIDVYADENFSATTGGSSMRFATTPLGSVLRLDRVFITNAGSMGIGTIPAASAQLDVSSTTKGFLPPRMTQAERNLIPTPVEGLMIYNLTTKKPNFYTGYEWQNFDGTSDLSIGDNYQGGKIAYIFQPTDPGWVAGQTHGLIAAASDQSISASWGCNGVTIQGADGTTLGTGNQNTIDIMADCATAGIAARICGDLVLSGYSDWYLPSKDELNKLYINRVAVGGFALDYYWSSSEISNVDAWIQFFVDGVQDIGSKSPPKHVRAVRTF